MVIFMKEWVGSPYIDWVKIFCPALVNRGHWESPSHIPEASDGMRVLPALSRFPVASEMTGGLERNVPHSSGIKQIQGDSVICWASVTWALPFPGCKWPSGPVLRYFPMGANALLGGSRIFWGLFIATIRSDRCSVAAFYPAVTWPPLFPNELRVIPNPVSMVDKRGCLTPWSLVARCDDTATSWMWLCYGVFIPCVCVCYLCVCVHPLCGCSSPLCVFIPFVSMPCVSISYVCVCSSLVCVHLLCGVTLLCAHLLRVYSFLVCSPLCVCVHLLCVCSPLYVCSSPMFVLSPLCIHLSLCVHTHLGCLRSKQNFSLSTWYLPIFS